ncbi:MAG: bis(5'-nucleosyl)-tetraphosphatase (symmetrical) YqeK [Bacteroides sp.]
MKSERIEDITEKLKKKLTPGRFTHTLGVAYTAACMAMRYGENMEKAYIAGLLHDCAKCISDEEKIRRCEENGIEITESERDNPSLLHAKLGAWYAWHKYDVRDEEICSAIRFHTTGRPYMTLLEKIIFVADYIEPNRNKAPDLERIRHICFEDIDKGVCVVAHATLEYLDNTSDRIDEATAKTYEYYRSITAMSKQSASENQR